MTDEDRKHFVLWKRALTICHQHGHAHLPGTLSALQVMESIFERFNPAFDTFILSKGHAAVALYACLEQLGHKPDLTKTHPERDPANGIICTTGSLGHGLPMAVGIALANHLKGSTGKVYVLMGDGECLEGTTWESLCLAQQWNLGSILEVHIDGNGCGALGELPVNVAPRLRILFPDLIHYHTTQKGYGVSFLQGTKDHKRVLTDSEYHQAINELT